MTLPGVVVGRWAGPFEACLDRELLRAYAHATKDPSPAVKAGEVAAAGAIVTTIWKAQEAGRAAAVPAEFQRASKGGVHGEHEFLLHRPIVPGELLRIWVEGFGTRPAGRNSAVTLHYVTRDGAGDVVAEQWWTTVFFGVTCEQQGRPAPERIRRIAVRFATPTFLGEQLHVRVCEAGPLGYAFEADSLGASVITHGRAELR